MILVMNPEDCLQCDLKVSLALEDMNRDRRHYLVLLLKEPSDEERLLLARYHVVVDGILGTKARESLRGLRTPLRYLLHNNDVAPFPISVNARS